MKRFLDFLTLFSSTSTLFCCALPALLVAIGAGSVMASIASNVPGFIWISQNKIPVFIFAGIMLMIGGLLQIRSSKQVCPVDPVKGAACRTGTKWSFWIYMISLCLYLIGGFFAFIAVHFI